MRRAIELLTYSWLSPSCKSLAWNHWAKEGGLCELLPLRHQAGYDKASHWPINAMHRFQRCLHCDQHTIYVCEKCKCHCTLSASRYTMDSGKGDKSEWKKTGKANKRKHRKVNKGWGEAEQQTLGRKEKSTRTGTRSSRWLNFFWSIDSRRPIWQ